MTEKHDKVISLEACMREVRDFMRDFKDGKLGPCLGHTEQLRGIWSNIDRLWWAFGLLFVALGIKWIVG